MPELPEVEAARKLAELHCAGKKIVAADVREDTSASRTRCGGYCPHRQPVTGSQMVPCAHTDSKAYTCCTITLASCADVSVP